jgi:hypothetical protein
MKDEPHPARDNDRLSKILEGAFSGAPTPLKDIPTRKGKLRVQRRQRKKRAA